MNRTVLMAAAMTVMVGGGLMAANKPAAETAAAPNKPAVETAAAPNKEQQMETLGALRARLMLRLTSLGKAIDSNQNGAQAARDTIDKINSAVSKSIKAKLDEENAKADPDRPLLDTLNKKNQEVSDMRGDFEKNYWTVYSLKMGSLNQVHGALNQIFQNVANVEMAWNTVGFDLNTLIELLTMIEKKTDESKAQALEITGSLTKQVAVWEEFAKNNQITVIP